MRAIPVNTLIVLSLLGTPSDKPASGDLEPGGGSVHGSVKPGLEGERPFQQTAMTSLEAIQTGDLVTYRIPGSDVRFDLIGVSGGTFRMGHERTEDGSVDDASPAVEVSVSGFLIGRFEVTYNEYAIFQYANRDSDSTAVEGKRIDVDAVARPSPPYEDPSFGMGGYGYPAVGMTQWAALQYVRWLSEKTGEFFRLPTEAEWEYACKAGTGSDFSMGGSPRDVSDVAWYEDNSDYRLHPVGEKTSNAWGLHDMHGNAAEWMLDQYDAAFYEELAASDRTDPWREPERLHPRTVRGGNYGDSLDQLGCSVRKESSMNWKRRDPQIPKSFWWNTDSPFVGFRLVRPLIPPSPEDQEAFWQLVLGE